MNVKVRFAPSPTGFLHVGNVRTALVNWLFARKNGGYFLLRIDDTDAGRSKSEYTAAIREDLRWLGLDWDGEEHQSQRFESYREAAEKLRTSGRLYACYETPEELDVQRKMQTSRGLPPIYNRTALKLAAEQKKKYAADGRQPHYRFLLNDEEIQWDDLIRGHTHFRATHMSDPVLLREDGVPVYTLASVVDDGELAITHVIRGEDHVSNTAVQVQLYQALGFAVPQFAHMALLKTKEGELSKRLGGNDIRALREAGILPMAVNSLLARIGTSDAVEPFLNLPALTEGFDFKKFGRAPAIYNPEELHKLSAKLFRSLPYETVREMIKDHPQKNHFDKKLWDKIHSNIKTLTDLNDWLDILFRESFDRERLTEYQELLHEAARILSDEIPEGAWTDATWKQWIALIQQHFESRGAPKKGKDLFMPLRLALTNKLDGPELKDVFLVLGEHGYAKDKVSSRLYFTSRQVSYGGKPY
ncbi:MAG: glutamate--tRNA ligase [Pseudomonadota bacterium]|nr:glutamate--tRNA ligase [Pseudomonadota bacterium]MDE3038216.1 glutamate--tRNA ligase [Pseudomonadota bacterium]